MAVSYILIRPPQLPELGDPSDAFIVGYDPSTDKTVKIKVANIGGGSVSPPLDISWKSNIEYSSGEIVEYGLRLWKSLQGTNEGNFPTEGIWWTEVARGNQSITYWAAGVYTQDPTIKLVNDVFYRLDAALPFESVNFANELANGDWVAIGGGGGGGLSTFDDLTDTPSSKIAKKLVKVSDNGQDLEYTDYDFNAVVELSQIDLSDIGVGESKILTATKTAGGEAEFSGAISQLDKIGPPGLTSLLAETNPLWDGDEITLTGNNLNSTLGENSQEYNLGADFFLCTSHDTGTTTSNGSATWVRNRGQDALSTSIAHESDIVDELEVESGWNQIANFKQITKKSKQGSWYRSAAGGYLYMCVDKLNGWIRVGFPTTINIEITTTSHPILTANLLAHDFVTNGFYDQSSDGTNESASQAQEYWDTANNAWYKRNMDGFWAKMI